MCGIAGILNLSSDAPIEEARLRRMLAMIRHRGPDQYGIYLDDDAGLGSARLSIIDLHHGQQPVSNEDGSLWIVYNGEVFNYLELRPELEARGHRFTTDTDTEVVLHLYEEFGPECLLRLNGQFAIAIWDSRKKKLLLARDRLGVCPIYYTITGKKLLFGSEVKALFAAGDVKAEIDPVALGQIFTYWSPLSPRSAFRGVREVSPGHYLEAYEGSVSVKRYWKMEFPNLTCSAKTPELSVEEASGRLENLLVDAAKIRLRADVPVGAYLSGGLDSSLIASIIRNESGRRLSTFSISFDDPKFDESGFQRSMARWLGTEHQVARVKHEDIGRIFPEVIWHTETPILRTSPAPMFLLSRLVRDAGYKVILTGEGADEFLAGYDIFKEAKIRRFWARQAGSTWRYRLFERLYTDVGGLKQSSNQFLSAFFRGDLLNADSPHYSHEIRWRNTRRTHRFFSAALLDEIGRASEGSEFKMAYPDEFQQWGPLERSQYLEITIFLSQYLLSSQGDRMAMAHSVEGRFPFLDYPLIAFCNSLPAKLKLKGLREKFILKKVAHGRLPGEILTRPKRPYRAPIQRSFFNDHTEDYVKELLSSERLKASGHFRPEAVEHLIRKAEGGQTLSEAEDMGLAGIISTQLIHHLFVTNLEPGASIPDRDDLKRCFGPRTSRNSSPDPGRTVPGSG
ncbi:MAG: asparagine synthase (glutamine-hydrolyzing) [Verrucomicrobia bacterium]|nr:MAG: asparagine synthase (glutamine-hydrolyzing) [Verrucomicrobiota bacterium]